MSATTRVTRRAAVAGAATLPLAPIASSAESRNATDTAWAEYQAALGIFRANQEAHHAFEAALPTGAVPRLADFQDWKAFQAGIAAWNEERVKYPTNPYSWIDDDWRLKEIADRIDAAGEAVLEAPAATLINLERKLIVAIGWESPDNPDHVPPQTVQQLLADVRAMTGRAA